MIFSSLPHIITSYFRLAAPADVLAPGRGCAERGGSPVTSLLPGSEQQAVESTNVPGCRNGGHSTQRHTEPGESRQCEDQKARRLWLIKQMKMRFLCICNNLKFYLLPQDELENYNFKSIYRCDAINTEKHFPSLLMLICQGEDQKKPDIHFFNCETMRVSNDT